MATLRTRGVQGVWEIYATRLHRRTAIAWPPGGQDTCTPLRSGCDPGHASKTGTAHTSLRYRNSVVVPVTFVTTQPCAGSRWRCLERTPAGAWNWPLRAAALCSSGTQPRMTTRSPLVSIVIPAYNAERFLGEALASV